MAKRDVLPNPMFTPAEIAKQWGGSPDKVIEWIKSGELRAVTMATRPEGRPRYKVDQADLEAFLLRRSITSSPGKGRRRRRLRKGVAEYR